ncbi:MAG: hypothetical protein ACKV0T_26115 [Planctomycetales bacterium]
MSAPGIASRGRPLDRFLDRLSIDPVAYRALVRAYFLMDFRNQHYGKSTATGPKALITPLFWVLGQNLIMGLICAVVLFARVDIEFFTLVGLTVSMITVGAAVVVEFNEIVFDPQDLSIIGHRPIPARTYAAARVTNLLAYLLLTSCSVGLFPALVGSGMRDAGGLQVVAYAVGALVGDLVCAGLVILGYLVVFRGQPKREAQEMLAWLQVLLIMLLFYGGQLLLRDPQQKVQWLAYALPDWIVWWPAKWLAQGVVAFGQGGGGGWWILPTGVVVAGLVWMTILSRLSAAYGTLQPGRRTWAPHASPALPRPGELGAGWIRWLTRPGEERAAFWLAWTMLRRDPNLRMRCWPSMAIVLAMLGTGAATGQLKNPAAVPPTECILTLAAMYAIGGSVPALLHNLRFSEDFAASWILGTAPVGDAVGFVGGMRKAMFVHFILPVTLLMLGLLGWLWRDPVQGAIHAGLAGCVAWSMTCGCSVLQLRRLPFALPLARGGTFGPIAPLSAATTALGMSVAVLHGLTARQPWAWGVYVVALLLGTLLIQSVSNSLLRRRLAGGMLP